MHEPNFYDASLSEMAVYTDVEILGSADLDAYATRDISLSRLTEP